MPWWPWRWGYWEGAGPERSRNSKAAPVLYTRVTFCRTAEGPGRESSYSICSGAGAGGHGGGRQGSGPPPRRTAEAPELGYP
ncbi:hypothetical protein OV427_04160 [Pyxidicoccus sp. MSG2]|nr:hypothetical protein [Pyxidicoccus sp. MSG2]